MNKGKTMYAFTGIDTEGYEWHISPGVLLVKKEEAEKVGGWDENYCGSKGGSDGAFRSLIRKGGLKIKRMKGVTVINYTNSNEVRYASAPFLDRSKDLAEKTKSKRDSGKNLFDNLRFKWEKAN